MYLPAPPPRPRAVPPPSSGPASPRPALNWRPVAVAGAAALLVVAAVLAWAVRRPSDRGGVALAAVEPAPAPTEPVVVLPAPVEAAEPALPQRPAPEPVKPALQPADEKPVVKAPAEADAVPCETFGTRVEFDGNPERAAQKAAQTQRLLMVLHISGNFEDAGFT
jgi:fused signal recognition particle receptor